MAGAVLMVAVVAVAPLAAGGVHRGTVLPLVLLAALALTLISAAEMNAGRSIRMTNAMAVLGIFAVIPALQSLPLPWAFQALIDPVGADLVAGAPAGRVTFRPYSLDPPVTRSLLGQASAAFAVFLVAGHLASGRSHRHLLLRGIVCSSLAAVVIGIGHRILGESRVYGTFGGSRGLLNGPFVNPNHTAELLELGFFAAVALAHAKKSVLNRVGWLSAAVLLIAGALGTLSRGAVLALAVAGTIFLVFQNAVDRDDTRPRQRSSLFWAALVLGLVIIVAGGLGAGQLVAKFSQTSFAQETRFRLWVDSLKLIAAHPMGIGRGAFERVYPTVRSLEGNMPVRFSFVENEPLQHLLESGWIGFAAVLAAVALVLREFYRQGRRDRVELALICGLIAVLCHNLVDFGLETLGVLLPFAAVLGTAVGRTKGWGERLLPNRRALMLSGGAVVGALLGAASLAHSSSGNFDAKIRAAATTAQRREIARSAQAAHPVDYFYVLAEASTEPLRPNADGHSPRLRLLNRALRLCPSCPEVHQEVALSLWALGKRNQALVEWRIASASRALNPDAVEAIWRLGVRPDELPVLGGRDPQKLLQIASFLLTKSAREGAKKVINSAQAEGAPDGEIHLLRAQLNFDEGAVAVALREIGAAEKFLSNDPRVFALRAEATLQTEGPGAALDVLDRGLTVSPYNLPLQRRRLRVVMDSEKWSRADGALKGLEIALFHAALSTTEVRLAAARIAARLGDRKRAISEYTTATNQSGNDTSVWMELGSYYESLGRYHDALAAFRHVQGLVPGNAEVAAAVQRAATNLGQVDAAARRSGLTTP